MMKRMTFFALSFMILILLFFPYSQGKSPEKLTVEWLFDEDVQDSLSDPRYEWFDNSTVLLLDFQVEREKRTIELFDPETGERSLAIDKDKVLSALRNSCGKDAPSYIQWPDAVDPKGKAVVYVIAGDLFCVELLSSNVTQLTKTSSEETSVAFSPDGSWVSFIRENDIYATEWRKGEEKRLTTGATDTLLNGPFSWVYWEELYDRTSLPYCWAPDSKAIAYLQTDDSQLSISTFVNFEPATQEAIRQRYPKAGQENPKVRLGVVELSSAKTTWMDCGKYEYLARFNWLRDSTEIAVQTLNRRQSELRLMFVETSTGKRREIFMEKQPAWINLNNSLYFLKDGKRFIWLSERDGYQHLYLYGTDGQLIRQLTKGNFMVLSSEGDLDSRNGGLVGVDEETGWVYFTSNKHALKERHLYRIRIDGTGFERLRNEAGVHKVNFSPCMKYFLDTYSNSQTPPALYLHKADGERIKTIVLSAKNILQNFNLTYPEFQAFRADDGLILPAMMTKPVNFNPKKKYPAIVYVYGGPGSQEVVDRWRERWLWHSLLAQEGFFVFVFEIRAGMGENKALETSVYKQAYGMQNVRDILDGVNWLKHMRYIDRDRLGIWGKSGGGCTTLYTMTHSDAFKAGVAVAPVSDWHFYDTIYTERYQGTPQDNPEGYKETSSVVAAKNLKGKLLIVHGTYDDNVHPQNTYAFVDKLIEHGINFEMMIYPWRNHDIDDIPAKIHLHNLMLDFWKQNLK